MSALSFTTPAPGVAISSSPLTTGAAARVCGVDRRTVARWIDAGMLPSHRTPGGRRRVLERDLFAFLRARAMPALDHEGPRSPRIGIADDDPMVRRAIARTVRHLVLEGEVAVAHDGFTAGALVYGFRPHLVFLDVVMPGMSGVEVCRFLRAQPELAGMAVVVVSGHVDRNTRQALEATGVERIVKKPFTTADIATAIEDFLDPVVRSEAARSRFA